MKTSELKKLNREKTEGGVLAAIAAAGFEPFEESESFKLMSIFKCREKHTRRKRKDGIYLKLQCFTSPEGAEDCEFVALSADEKLEGRGPDGKKFAPLRCEIFVRKIIR